MTSCSSLFESHHGGTQSRQVDEDTTLFCVQHDHRNITKIVDMVLNLQSELLIHSSARSSTEKDQVKNGFLIAQMSPQDLLDSMQDGAEILLVCRGKAPHDQLAGYLILNSLESFEKYTRQDELTLSILPEKWNYFLRQRSPRYIEQIAVSHSYFRSNIGTQLIQYSKERTPQGLIAAVVSEPFENHASYQFFTCKHQFKDVGSLEIPNFQAFGSLKSHVLIFPYD